MVELVYDLALLTGYHKYFNEKCKIIRNLQKLRRVEVAIMIYTFLVITRNYTILQSQNIE